MNIFLIGLPGSGKTTIGRQLATELGFYYLDLDKVLEAKVGRFIEDIWLSGGEKTFRKYEKLVLKEEIPKTGNYIIACGGGVVLDPKNKKYLNGIKFFLDTKVDIITKRLFSEKDTRPLLRDVSLEILEQERFLKYKDFADVIVSNNFDPQTTIKVIINYMKAFIQ